MSAPSRPQPPEVHDRLRADDEAVRRLGEFLFVDDDVVDAEATIVLGMTLWHRPLARALELHREGRSGVLLLTGGHNPRLGTVEALAMRDEARSRGVDERGILVDPHAVHTGENFANCLRLIEAQGLLRPGRAAINVVAIGFHMRRALLTAASVFPAGVRIGAAGYPSVHYPDHGWHLSSRGRADVLGEVAKIGRYFPDSLPPDIRRLADRLSGRRGA